MASVAVWPGKLLCPFIMYIIGHAIGLSLILSPIFSPCIFIIFAIKSSYIALIVWGSRDMVSSVLFWSLLSTARALLRFLLLMASNCAL